MHFCQLSQNWNLKVELGTHLRENHGHLFLWYLELFWHSFKVVKTKVENMNFCRLSQNRVLKADLGTHFKDKHGHLFLWDLEPFWPSFKVGQTKVENMNFCQLSRNWNLTLDLGTLLRDKRGNLFCEIWSYLARVQGWSNQGWKYPLLSTFSGLKFESWFKYPFER